MSKAYQCDNCLECYPGDAPYQGNNRNELCPGCFRALKFLGSIDPFFIKPKFETEEIYDATISWRN